MKKLKGFLPLAFIVNGAAMVTYAAYSGVLLVAALSALLCCFAYFLSQTVYLILTTVEAD